MAIEDLKESLGIDDDDFKGIKDGVNALDKSTSKFRKGMKGAKSVIKAAKGNIFEFPVFVSSSVPLDYATATTSLLEQVYASYLQMAISANPVITAKSAANGTQFAHLKSDTNKYLECVDTSYQADAAFNHIDLGYTMNGDNKFVEFSLINVNDSEARIINEQCDYQPLSEFDHFFTEAKSVPKPVQISKSGKPGVGTATPAYWKRKNSASPSFADASEQYENIQKTKAQRKYTKNQNESLKRELDAKKKISNQNNGKDGTYEDRIENAELTSKEAQARIDLENGSPEAIKRERKIRRAQHKELTEKISNTLTDTKGKKIRNQISQKELDSWDDDHDEQEKLNKKNISLLEKRLDQLNRELGADDAIQKDGLGSSFYREKRAELKSLEAHAIKDEHDSSEKVLKTLDEIMNLDKKIKTHEETIKSAQAEDAKDRAQAELEKLQHERELAKHKLDDYIDDHEKQQAKIDVEIDKINAEIEDMAKKYDLDLKKEAREAEKYEYEKSNRRAEDLDRANRGRIRAPQFMDETKIQKLNTMKPLMMTVDLNVEGKDGRIVQGVEYIVGVKAYNRLVDSSTLPEVVEYPLKEMNKITRKAKWRAGELKFFKDILFKIPQKKQTAIDSRDPKRKWYRRLYELAHIKGDAPAKAIINGDSVIKAFFKDKLGKYGDTNGVIPNATLVISKADVDIIKRETKIDMLKGSSASKFCKELFMIGIVVIDNDAESIKILLPDLHNDYEVHSLSSVNKQLSLLDTSGTKTRDIFKLLG